MSFKNGLTLKLSSAEWPDLNFSKKIFLNTERRRNFQDLGEAITWEERKAKRVVVNLSPRAKRETKEFLVNLQSRAKGEAKEVLVNIFLCWSKSSLQSWYISEWLNKVFLITRRF